MVMGGSACLWGGYKVVTGWLQGGKGRFQKRFSGFFPLRGGGYPPIPLRKKSAKKQLFWPKNAYFSPFDPFFEENFRQFSVKGGGTPPFL